MKNKEISKILEKLDKEKNKRTAYANSILVKDGFIDTTQFKNYERLLNISGQNEMTSIMDFYDRNSDITPKIIADKMRELKCLHFQPFKEYGKTYIAGIPRPPYTDLSLIPYFDDSGKIIEIEEDIVLSPGVEKILQDVCDNFREHNDKNNLYKAKHSKFLRR